jgi:hypothetical protein
MMCTLKCRVMQLEMLIAEGREECALAERRAAAATTHMAEEGCSTTHVCPLDATWSTMHLEEFGTMKVVNRHANALPNGATAQSGHGANKQNAKK